MAKLGARARCRICGRMLEYVQGPGGTGWYHVLPFVSHQPRPVRDAPELEQVPEEQDDADGAEANSQPESQLRPCEDAALGQRFLECGGER